MNVFTEELRSSVTTGLELACNTWLAMDPQTLAGMSRLEGKVIAVEVRGLNLNLFMLPGTGGLQILHHYAGAADTTLSGAPFSLLRLVTGNSRQVLFSGDVVIRGDVDTGQHFKRLLENMDIDWEEHLSRLTGDVVAYRIGNGLRQLRAWVGETRDQVAQNVAEYAQHEARTIPLPAEAEALYTDIDTLRDDTARLEARLQRLQQQAKTTA